MPGGVAVVGGCIGGVLLIILFILWALIGAKVCRRLCKRKRAHPGEKVHIPEVDDVCSDPAPLNSTGASKVQRINAENNIAYGVFDRQP